MIGKVCEGLIASGRCIASMIGMKGKQNRIAAVNVEKDKWKRWDGGKWI